MTKIKTLLLASAAAIVAAGAASAADIGRSAPVRVVAPAPVFSWTGFYLGVHGGGGWADSQSDFQTGGSSPADFNLDGPYVGAQIGFNWQMSSIVLGLEADASWSGIHGSRNPSNANTNYIHNQDIDYFGTVRGRLGVSMGNWMPYLTGGWAWGQGTRFSSGTNETRSGNHNGWTAGAGIEWALTNHWSVKGEYKYITLNGGNYNFSQNASTVDIKLHTAEIGLNYKF